jgi:hypothetical protein
MFHESLSFVVDNQEIYVRFHLVLFQLVNVIDVLVQMYEVFPKDNHRSDLVELSDVPAVKRTRLISYTE